MKRPLAYITAAWLSGDSENAEQAARYYISKNSVIEYVLSEDYAKRKVRDHV